MEEAIRRAAAIKKVQVKYAQSALATLVNAAYGTTLKPQNIQSLASRTPSKKTGKLARGSRNTSQIASVVGLVGEWLASGQGPRDAPNWKAPKGYKTAKTATTDPLTKSKTVDVKIKETGERKIVELTTEALRVAQIFMDLAGPERKVVLRDIERREKQNDINRKLNEEPVPDGALDHLAAPGTEPAKRAAAKRKATKTPLVKAIPRNAQ